MLPYLIGLYSSAPGCGKSEVALNLQQRLGYVPVKFAETLKSMTSCFLEAWGMSHVLISRALNGDLKEAPIEGLGVTCRSLMQTLGTDWGRTCVDPEVWIKVTMRRVNRLLEMGERVVVDDMRFPNEYQALDLRGGCMINVTRPGVVAPNGHASEGLLDHHPFKATVTNDGTLEELRLKILSTIQSL